MPSQPLDVRQMRDELYGLPSDLDRAAYCDRVWSSLQSVGYPLATVVLPGTIDCLSTLLLISSCSQSTFASMVATESFWTHVGHGLAITSKAFTPTRKAALRLFSLGLAALPSPTPRSPGWASLDTVFTAVLDFPMHLLLSGLVQDALACLLPPCAAAAGSSCSLDPPTHLPVPNPALPPPIEWCALAVDSLLHHENSGVAKNVLAMLLRQAANLGPTLPLATIELIASGSVWGCEPTAQAHPPPGLPQASPASALQQALRQPEGTLASYSGACASTDGSEEGVRAREEWEHKAWKLGELPSTCAAAAGSGDTHLLLCLPPWHVCASLLPALAQGPLWPGETTRSPIEGTAKAALVAYLQAYPFPSSHHQLALLRAMLCSLVSSRLAYSKTGLRVVLTALLQVVEGPAVQLAAAAAAAGSSEEAAGLLTPHTLRALAVLYVEVSLNSSRTYSAAIASQLLRLLCSPSPSHCTPLTPATLPPAAALLALLPAAVVLLAEEGSGSAAAVAAQPLLTAWLATQQQQQHVLEATRHYLLAQPPLSQPPTHPASACTAVGLARLLAAQPTPALQELLASTLASALTECAASASASASASATAEQARHRALLLLQALCWAAWPGGGSGDAHLGLCASGAHTSGYGGWEGEHPLHLEFQRAVRAAGGVMPAAPLEVAALESVVVGEEEEGGRDGGDVQALGRDMQAVAGAGATEATLSPCTAAAAATLTAAQAAVAQVLLDARVCRSLPEALLAVLAPCLDAEGASGSSKAWAVALLFSSGMAAAAAASSGRAEAGSSSSSSSSSSRGYTQAAASLLLRAVRCLRSSPEAVAASTATFACLLIWRLGELGMLAVAAPSAPLRLTPDLLEEALATVLTFRAAGGGAASRQAFEVHRWVAAATLASSCCAMAGSAPGARTLTLTPASQRLFCARTVEALEQASEAALPSILSCLALALQALAADCAASASGAGAGLQETAARTCAAALASAEGAVWRCKRPSRSILLHYACAVAQLPPLLCPQLQPVFTEHLGRAAGALGAGGAMPPYALQILTARLVAVWGQALAECSGSSASSSAEPNATAAASQGLLTAHMPLMLALALYREPLAMSEEPVLLDSAARRQFFGWLKARQQLEEEEEGGEGGEEEKGGALPLGAAGGAAATPAAAEAHGAALMNRGAGALCRLQVLCFFDSLATRSALSARTSSPAAAAAAAAAPPSLFPITLQRALILRLCRMHAQPLWLTESSPGTPLHVLRLRAWQALVCLSASWGAGGAVSGAGAGQAAAGDVVYAVQADSWLPVGGEGSSSSSSSSSDCASALQLQQWASTCAEAGVEHLLRVGAAAAAAGSAAAPQPAAATHSGSTAAQPAVSKKASKQAVAELQVGMARTLEMAQEVCAAAAAAAATTSSLSSSPPTASEPSDSAVALCILCLVFHAQLHVPQQPSTRHYMEAVGVALTRRFPRRALQLCLLPTLTDFASKNQPVFSALLVAADAAMHFARLAAGQGGGGDALPLPPALLPPPTPLPPPLLPAAHALTLSLTRAIFPWVTASVGLSRLLAHCALHSSLSTLGHTAAAAGTEGSATATTASSSSSTQLQWMAPLLAMLEHCPDIAEQRRKCSAHLQRVAPAAACSLLSLATSPVSEHGEIVPRDAFSYISGVFRSLSSARHREDVSPLTPADALPPALKACLRAGLLPAAARHHACLRWPLAWEWEGEGEGVYGQVARTQAQARAQAEVAAAAAAVAAAAAAPGSGAAGEGGSGGHNFQRKHGSAAEGGGGAEGGEAAAAAAAAQLLATLTDPAAAAAAAAASRSQAAVALPRPHPLLAHIGEGGRPHSGFIVCASLVDKAPNLGGLARTCEIFGAEALVLPEGRVTGDPGFLATSLDAERLLPLHVVPPGELIAYIRARRALGYTAVALEQAARSVALGSAACVLPRRMLLVLGAEKEGLPVDVLAEVDMVVEIPQLGVLRSLNVHVSASLVIFEHVKQGLLGLEGGGR